MGYKPDRAHRRANRRIAREIKRELKKRHGGGGCLMPALAIVAVVMYLIF